MNQRLRAILLIIFGLFAVIPLVLMLQPEGTMDLSKDEEPFRSMVLPPKSALGYGYMDGGSVGFLLIDKNGAKFEINFPIDYNGVLNHHPTAIRGNIDDRLRIPLKDPPRAKAIVIRLLKKYGPTNDDQSNEKAIHALSEPLVQIPGGLWKNLNRSFEDWAGSL